MPEFDAKLLRRLTATERDELDQLLASDRSLWRPLPGPQFEAYHSTADIVGYGGAAGGGKTDLGSGLMLMEHKRSLVIRREKAQTEGIVQRLTQILGANTGLNSQKAIWNLPTQRGGLIEFGGLDNLGDERRWQGRPHDLIFFDEATEQREAQVRFIMGWSRSDDPAQRLRVLMTFNPPTTTEGRWVLKYFGPWLHPAHPNPAKPGELRWFTTIGENGDYEVSDSREFVIRENGSFDYSFDRDACEPEKIIKPKSRTFIPARVTDNPYYVAGGYIAQLQSLPEPLRSQMLYGDFRAGVEDDPWQVIPTEWIALAMARWKLPDKLAPMDSVGVDVARGGKDNTVIARRHGLWFDKPITYPGSATPDGPMVAGLAISVCRDQAVIHIDAIGVGASPYDFLNEARQQVVGVIVSEVAHSLDKTGRLRFKNQRSEQWWRMREALDPTNNTGIALPDDPRLRADLAAPRWSLSGSTIYVESREDIIKNIGRSPDWASAYLMALIDTPKRAMLRAAGQRVKEHDPYARD